MIYLDSNATTEIDPRVVDAMMPYLTTRYANPSASYRSGREVHKAIEHARGQIAQLIDAEPEEIMFTSGGTESNNAAIFSALTLYHQNKTHLIIVKTEHSAVLEPAKRWMMEGHPVSFLDVDREGRVNMQELGDCVRPGETAVVSVMWANNETGVLGPVPEAADFAHARGALFHTDAVQAVGKVPISVKQAPVDYLSLSGHKFHAPKGIGALYISKRARYKAWMLGGGQESGRRSGTENVANIVAMGKAAELMQQSLNDGTEQHVAQMRDALELAILGALPDTVVNGSKEHRLGTTTNLTFPGVAAAGLLILLDQHGVECSGGSACHTTQLHPSHVLEAMRIDAEQAQCSVRFSFSRFNTMEQVRQAGDIVIRSVKKMRELRGDGQPVILSSQS